MSADQIPAVELERVASLLYAFARAARDESQALRPWSASRVLDPGGDLDRFVTVCAEHGVEITVDRDRPAHVIERIHADG